MKAFAHHFAFELRTGIRNRQSLLMNYLLPLGFYFMLGFIMPGLNPFFQDNMIPAMVVFAILAATFLGLPDPLVNAREAGIFRSYKINGVPTFSILVIPALTTVLHTAVMAVIIIVTAPLLFDAPLPVHWPGFVVTFIVMAFACAGLAVLIAVISPSSKMTVLWSQLVFLPSMLLGGMMIPYRMLPETAGKIAQILPTTHAMNAFRGMAQDLEADFDPWASIAILLTSGIMAFVLATWLFNWDRHNATRRGHPLCALLALLPYAVGILFIP
jgi:ABC-2 type transport system permease protein